MTASASYGRARRPPPFDAAFIGAILACSAVEGVLVAVSPKVAVAALAPIVVAVALEVPGTVLVGALLTVRVLTDASAGIDSHQHAALGTSSLIAILLLILAALALYRGRTGTGFAVAGTGIFLIFALLAVYQLGASTVSLREPVREASIVAVGLLALNLSGFGVAQAAAVVQVAGVLPALLALYQAASGRGMDIAGSFRSNGTFSHPNSAAVYFAVAALASMWKYWDGGRKRIDLLLLGLFAGGLISTFSLGGAASFLVMLLAFGGLRTGAPRVRFAVWVAAGLVAIVFVATPIGASRLAQESSSQLSVRYQPGQGDSSLQWRVYNWKSLLPEWEASPVIGSGLGATVMGRTPTGLPPHNEYIRYLVETGIAGIVVFGCAALVLVRGLLRRRSLVVDHAAVLALAVFAGLSVDALVANTFVYTPGVYAATLLVAAAMRPTEPAADLV